MQQVAALALPFPVLPASLLGLMVLIIYPRNVCPPHSAARKGKDSRRREKKNKQASRRTTTTSPGERKRVDNGPTVKGGQTNWRQGRSPNTHGAWNLIFADNWGNNGKKSLPCPSLPPSLKGTTLGFCTVGRAP